MHVRAASLRRREAGHTGVPVTKRKEGKPPKVPHAALRMNVVAETKIFGNGPSMQAADAVQPLPAIHLPDSH